MSFLSLRASRPRRRSGRSSDTTEDGVVRDLWCDNQELKIGKKRKKKKIQYLMVLKKTLLLLLHSPSTSFFLSSSSVFPAAAAAMAAKSYSHLKQRKRERRRRNVRTQISPGTKQNTHTPKKEETQMKKTEKGGLKSNCCARSRCSCSPGAAGNWDTMWNDGGGGGDGGPDRPTDRLALSLSWSVWEGTVFKLCFCVGVIKTRHRRDYTNRTMDTNTQTHTEFSSRCGVFDF